MSEEMMPENRNAEAEDEKIDEGHEMEGPSVEIVVTPTILPNDSRSSGHFQEAVHQGDFQRSMTTQKMANQPFIRQAAVGSSSSVSIGTVTDKTTTTSDDILKVFTGAGTQQLEFYRIISTEDSCIEFLRSRGLLPSGGGGGSNSFCHKERFGVPCGGTLRDIMRKSRNGTYYKSLRCTRRGCGTFVSIRKSNKFFTHTDMNGRCNSGLSICRILELCWMWANAYPMDTVEQLTGRTPITINDWYNYCREVCDAMYHLRQPMGGAGEVVLVDEFLCIDKDPFLFDIEAKTGKLPEDEDPAKNYGTRTEGPWIVAISLKSQTKVIETRLICVQNRDEDTLIPLIEGEVIKGTTIRTDNWYGYADLSRHGYIHETQKNPKLFTEPITGNRTKCIDRLWSQVRRKYVIKARSANNLNLHLREEWWRSINSTDSFNAFLRDVKKVFYADDLEESVNSLLDET